MGRLPAAAGRIAFPLRLAPLVLALSGCAAAGPAGTAPRAAAPPAATDATAGPGTPLAIVASARAHENQGAYARALADWRRLRPLVKLDGDLELATALDEARSGQLDSAAVRLAGRVLGAAALDTLPTTRFRYYPPVRDTLFLNGAFDGWHWYVWRARAEVAARRGRWAEATAAARQSVAARPASGREWLLLAVCAGRAGEADEARAAARIAAGLDASCPEALYLDALWAWKDGRRAAAQDGFRSAVSADSTFQPAVVALVRSRLPGSAPDSLPSEVLIGPRAVALLTSPARPKLDDAILVDRIPILARKVEPSLSDSLKAAIPARKLPLWLFIDEDGRVILTELSWFAPETYPSRAVPELMAQMPYWRFLPAQIEGRPLGVWMDMNYAFPR